MNFETGNTVRVKATGEIGVISFAATNGSFYFVSDSETGAHAFRAENEGIKDFLPDELELVIVLTYTHAIQNSAPRNIVYTIDKAELAKKHFFEMLGQPVHLNPVSSYEFDFTNYKYKR